MIDWDPMPLSVPCDSENGTWLPIHWTVKSYLDEDEDEDDVEDDRQQFISVLQAGMQYFREKLGFLFREATQAFPVEVENEDSDNDDDNEIHIEASTPFRLACERLGRDAVIKIFNDCISDHCADADSMAAAANTSPPICTESNLLLLAVTDETIHLDGLYILMRNDPTAALLRLQQKLLIREGQIINTNNNTNNNGNNSDNDNNSNTADSFNTTSTTMSSSNIASSCIPKNTMRKIILAIISAEVNI
jgi:hypothetical protein